MKVAVVTPYFQEPPSWIERCMASVRAQTHPCTHFMVSDGHALDVVDEAGVRHVRLGRAHADYGNTPRAIGGLLAVAEGFDAVCFLDADNWYARDHVAACVATAEHSHADFVVADRRLVRDDGSVIPLRTSDDADGSHVDTNCMFLLFGAFHTIPRWALAPRPMASLFDRFYLQSLRAEGLREAHTGQATVDYLCTWASIFRAVGEEPPAYAKENVSSERLVQWAQRLQPLDFQQVHRLTGCSLDRLRTAA
ncbi:MAG TPA: glycosyltransferase [Rubrivivax sp.]|nr:glycosyltransferase [Rubrivivax sp.]